ncbi:MAG: glycosyltransferase family 2 protein [Actinomycetota bacterium]|nr:glycosyltransferase family 2 protein [Actinomycetota bacterium]
MLGAWLYGYCWPDSVPQDSRRPGKNFRSVTDVEEVAVLIACRNGAGSIAASIHAARRNGCDVYVVSDASTDDTAQVAGEAGATVLALEANVGKPAALWDGYQRFRLSTRYKAVAILDDDVQIEDDFVRESLKHMDGDTAIVVGKNLTLWPSEHRWNIWLAKRAFSYWNYQLVIRRIQSCFGVMNCVSGSNSMYRTELLDELLPVPPPYIVDDTFWVLETQRRNLGTIVYAPKARAHLQDPTNFGDWYRQNLRWMWGTFQGIIGHRVGRTNSRFDVAYVLLMLHWLLYVAGTPLTLWIMAVTVTRSPQSMLLFVGLYVVWVLGAAFFLRSPRLLILAPVLLVIDLVYRVVFVHALIKALRQPTVSTCVWASPARFATTK